MKDALAIVITVALIIGFFALIAWIVSVCVSYVFGIDFGLLKAAAAIILGGIAGGVLFGGRR